MRALSCSGASLGESRNSCEWQLRQIDVDGHAGEARFLDRGVAVAAIDAVVADVVLVAEGDRLLDRFERHVARLHPPVRHRDPAASKPSSPSRTSLTTSTAGRENGAAIGNGVEGPEVFV